ncbi:hypothetical protein M422DRAFT_229450 [Sphaerobolus stellatus SS14]|uniref:Major facilitator superfamily (MFS) profile domain-containing protein n=1 Tax=Sphaerobolus stellatus (strain SS14) TaxID=990650 RepID=A0A0C9V539_SPHS4|nr:hypothetical protein M422DRAFT_229450 [Sphaerobolus stellatus SS14]
MGATRAWCTLIGALLLQLCTVGCVSSFGIFQDFYSTKWLIHSSASDISWIGSMQLFLDLGLGIIGGKLYDAGYCRSTLLVGSLLFSFCSFMLSLAKENQYYQVFLSQGLGMGLGIALIYIPTCTLVAQHFKSRKAFAMGLLVSSSPLGGLMLTIMQNRLIHSNVGFQWGVRASAFLATGCLAVGNLLITIPPKSPPQPGHQADKGARLRDWPFSLTLIGGFVAQLGTFFPVFYVQLFARDHGISSDLAFYSLAILNVAGAVGRIIPNYLADILGAINMLIVCFLCSGLVGFAMLACDHVVGLVLFCIFYGFFFNGVISLYLPAAITLAPREGDLGTTLGIAIVPVGVASLIGNPVIGAILGPKLIWWKGVTFASVSLIASAFFQAAAQIIHVRRSRKVPAPSTIS